MLKYNIIAKMNEKENITPGPEASNSLWEKMVAD